MITIPVSVDITGGTAPYTFTFSSNNANVTFSSPTGTAPLTSTSTYSAATDVRYLNQTDIGNTVISVTFVDSKGCSGVLSPVVITNPCTLQSTIQFNGDFVFVANTTGGSGSYSYVWNYDTALFEPNGDTNLTDNILSLKLKKVSSPPVSSNITVLITDTNGCTLSKSYVHTFCYPTVATARFGLRCSTTVPANCSLTNVTSSVPNYDMKPLITPCANQVINWSSLSFSVPAEFCIVHLGNGLINVASSKNIGFTAIISYSISTTTGIQVGGTLIVNTPICTARTSFSAIPTTIQLVSGDIIGTDKIINVEQRVGGAPNWSTFAFTNVPTWGTVTLNGNREIVYDITNILTTPTIPDVIKWTMQDYSGNQVNITDTVLRDILAVPVTTTEVVCNSCGETTTAQDLLANDTGDIDRSTATIVLNDPEIVITKDSNNNFIFTSLPGASFNNLNSYKVANTQGAYSADQNFFVRVACVGTDDTPTLDLTCTVSKVFDIKDQFIGGNSFNDVFVETTPTLPTYASQGGVIVGAEGTVTLTGLANKTYTFQYTAKNQGACTPTHDDIGVLTVVHNATPFVNITGFTLVSTGVYSFTFTYSGIASSFTVTDDGVAAVYHTGIVANNGSGTFTLYAAAGSGIVISATTVCGVNTTDSQAI